MSARIVILTGASGAGKTTLAKHFLETYPAQCDVFFFDSIGVPPAEKMKSDYGGGEGWQRAMTLEWMARIQPALSRGRPVLFEGQMRIGFIQEALAAQKIATARVVLLDCDDETRAARLQRSRSQPELANVTMMNWARCLRDEARKRGIEVLDTGRRSFEDCAQQVKAWLFGESHFSG